MKQNFLSPLCLGFVLLAGFGCDRRSSATTQPDASSLPDQQPPASSSARSASAARRAAAATFRTALEALAREHDLDAARAGFSEATAQDPTFAPPRYNLALLEADENHFDEAVRLLQEVLDLEKSSALGTKAQHELNFVRQAQALWATPEGRTKVEYERALARARSLLKAGAVDEALAEASAAIRLDVARYEAHCIAADALDKLGRHAAAAAHVREGMHLAPVDLQPKLRQALAEVEASDAFDGEAQAADQALEERDYATAGDRYQAAWKLQPAREATGLRAAMMLALADRTDDATEILKKLVASTDPRVVREAAEQLKTLQNFKRQQQLARDAEASMARFRQQAGLPPDPDATANPAHESAHNPARPVVNPTRKADPVADLIDRTGAATTSARPGDDDARPAPAAPTTKPAKHDDVLDLINASK